ncbi:MAG TPA: MBL fold metallo-hydrolase [Blastocatellia bacterium]|nr:MBL fold metallo-hydrolase [Blastocatellia bacterium]
MKLTLLGSGTVVPDGARNSAGYFIEAGGVRLMMDCGAGTVHALARYGCDWERMTHLYVSHFHVDHVGELASLFFAFKHGMRGERHEPLTILGPRGLDRVMEGLRHAFGEKLFEPKFPVLLNMLAPGERAELSEEVTLAVTKTPHTDESLAARVTDGARAIGYTGDTDYSEAVARFFDGPSLMIAECSFRERREGVPHLAVKDVARMAAIAGAERLAVTHFYFEVDDETLRREIRRDYAGEILVGRDGLQVEV